MTETPWTAASSLAITEKGQQRSNRCVGVFFQLFNWNRRLAKKKFFSKKLFPPVGGAKRVSSKFGSDEKMPMAKLLLIADENRGGFPSMKKTGNGSVRSLPDGEQNNGTRTPGLVARLMGLESMPAVRRDKPKKAPVSNFYYNQERKHVKQVDNIGKESELCCGRDLNLEKELMKADSRPRKLQKTGFFDRRIVTKVGAEALQFKNVWPRSRKQHHKLSSPVKSPRVLLGRNAARLMGAATKILEPGLQATNRARCSLTYSMSPCNSLEDHTPVDGMTFSVKQTGQHIDSFGANSLNVQSMCNSCGNLLAAMDFCPNVEEQGTEASSSSEITLSEFSNASSHGSGNIISSVKASLEEGGETGGWRSVNSKCHGVVSPASQAKGNMDKRMRSFMDKKPHLQRGHVSLAHDHTQHDSNSSNQKVQKCSQTMPDMDRVHERSKLFPHHRRRDSSSRVLARTRNHVASNRNLDGHTSGMRAPVRVLDDSNIKMERVLWEKKDDSLSTVKSLARKRRQVNGSMQFENLTQVNPTIVKQKNLTDDVVHRNRAAPYVRSVSCSSTVKATFPKKTEGIGARNSKDKDAVSFTFSSTKKQGAASYFSAEMRKKQSTGEQTGKFSQGEEVIPDLRNENSSPLRVTALKGDALGALLEEKLRELTCLERDESVTGDTLSGRSAAILQELISALSIYQEKGNNCLDGLSSKDSLYGRSPVSSDCNHAHEMVLSPSSKFQIEAIEESSHLFPQHAADCDHPSPTSILEASFSNDSCLSESPSCISGQKLDNHDRHSHLQMQPRLHDPELLDSATSMSSRNVRIEALNDISSMLGVDATEIGLTGIKLNYARDVILNTELLFESLAQHDVDGMGADTFTNPLFLDKLETLADHLGGWTQCSLDILEMGKNQLRGFLFDCMIESLAARYSCYFKSSFREWTKLPLSLSKGKLAAEICVDIRHWRNLAGKDLETVVERDMSNFSGQWTDFRPEAFDTGMDIEREILQLLLDDLVDDL